MQNKYENAKEQRTETWDTGMAWDWVKKINLLVDTLSLHSRFGNPRVRLTIGIADIRTGAGSRTGVSGGSLTR